MRALLLFVCLVTFNSAWAEFPEVFNSEPESEKTLMPAAEAAQKFNLPEGFKATVFAAEPDVQNPIAMAWDGRGRLWIAENYTYAERGQQFQLDLRDRVVIFDNTRGDQFKKRTVFTDDVQMLTGIEVVPDGVYLMCPPKLLFMPDRDHDDVPDGPGEVVLDGFTVANGLKVGPDGWLYGRCGGSCPGRIGRPGTPDDQRLALEGGIWRYHPTQKRAEVLTSGTTNPWGHDWNDVGEMFYVNTVNGHLWHMISGAHFVRPFLLDPNRRTYKLIDFHADHWHFDTGKSWNQSRNGVANAYGGGHSHIGAMIYQGENWPEQFHGKLFTLNQHGKRANQEVLVRDGSGYVGKHGEDILHAGDPWFRGLDLATGPDGAVFVLDWSDTGECHEHTGVHRKSGRIYKISYTPNNGKSKPVDFDHDNITQLATNPSPWVRKQMRLRPRSGAAAELQAAFTTAQTSAAAVQLLFALNAHGGVDRQFLIEQLSHPDEHVRAWAIRLLSEHWPIDDPMTPAALSPDDARRVAAEATALMPTFQTLADSGDSSLVRLTLASTLQRLPLAMRCELAKPLVAHAADAEDHNLPMLIWYGLMPVVDRHATQLADVASVCQLPDTLRCISRCLAEEIEKHPSGINRLVELTASSTDLDFQAAVLTGMGEGLQGWTRAPQPAGWEKIAELKSDKLAKSIRELSVVFGDGRALDDVKQIALGKTGAPDEMRLDALRTLIQNEPDDLRQICEELLDDRRLRVTAAQGLAKFDDPKTGTQIVSRYSKVRAPFRPQIMSILCSRKSFANEMLAAMKTGKIPRADLSAFQVRQIHSFNDADTSQLVRDVWGEVRETPEQKRQIIHDLKARLTPELLAGADKVNGRKLFVKTCQACHRLYGEGGKVGPDLTGSNRDNMDYLLSNIVDPSGVVDKDFRMTVVLTDDGRQISGLVTDETDRTLKIQTATESTILSKDTIESRRVTDKSPMPEGLLDNLTDDQINDVISYLSHPTQVAAE